MQEFTASVKNEKKLYRKVRKKYRRWVVGNIGVMICIGLMVAIFALIINKSGAEFTLDILVVGIGVCFIPLLIALFCRALAVSGGREVLLNRLADKVVLTEKYLFMEYVPHARETVEFDYVRYRMKYEDIEMLEYQEEKGRLKIAGYYQILRYRQIKFGETPDNFVVENVTNRPFYLYAHYDSFDECMKLIQRMSGFQSVGGVK